ncbi:MAG: acyltransferase family protein, partial [Akkermansia muciniphila]
MSKCFSETFCSPSPHQAGDAIHGTYFPHIDGLRTFAVLAVVLYHLQEGICPGGYTGVDIFFVISGYLIGGGLIRGLKEGTFSLTSFYLRRIRRIMPAYFCLIAVVLAFGCVVLDCDDLRTLGRTVRSSALFITNIYFSRTTGDYFSPAAEENPLLNLWSLSVEEQFYLMIPLTLWLLWKFREKAVKPVLWGALGLSFFAAVCHMGHLEHNKAFYLLYCRAWELLAGCLLALAPAAGQNRGAGWLRAAGWAGILLPFACYTPSTPFPGYTAIPSVAGAALLIRYGNHGRSGRILRHPLSTGIGKISYSCTCGIGRLSCTGRTSVSTNALLGLCGNVPSPFFWVSSPGNSWKLPSGRPSHGKIPKSVSGHGSRVPHAGTCRRMAQMDGRRAGLLACSGQQHGIPEYWKGPAFPPSFGITPPDRAVVEKGNAIQHHHPELGDVTDYPFVLLGKTGQAPSFLLMGDSHAMASSPGFDEAARLLQRSGLFYRARLCPLSGISGSGDSSSLTLLRLMYPHWEHNMELILDWLENTPQVQTVFIHNRWIELVNNHRDTRLKQLVADGLRHTCARLRKAGKQIVLLGPVPEWTFGPRKL